MFKGFFLLEMSGNILIVTGIWFISKSSELIPDNLTVVGAVSLFVLCATGPLFTAFGFLSLMDSEKKMGTGSNSQYPSRNAFMLGVKYGALDQVTRAVGAGILLLLYNMQMVTGAIAIIVSVMGLIYVAPSGVAVIVYDIDNSKYKNKSGGNQVHKG